MDVTRHCKSQIVLDAHPKIFNVWNSLPTFVDKIWKCIFQWLFGEFTNRLFVNSDFVEEYSQMSVSHIDAFQSKTNNKC